jgi:serine/threonine protein kinase
MHYETVEEYNSSVVRVYGITQDPETKNYMMVLEYAENGSLRNYLDNNYDKLSWRAKFKYLWYIAFGLQGIHENDLIHRDLHSGNILNFSEDYTSITDMGLCKPADHNASENTKKSIYGVLPYIAPEVLRGQNYTKADIYSFGIIMYEVISGLPPYNDVSHGNILAIKICHGLRPRFSIKVPQLIIRLIKRCLDADPLNRPTAGEIKTILDLWYNFDNQIELQEQIKQAEETNNCLPTSSMPSSSLSCETHSEALYTSRLLNFDNLPEPKNSDDYYDEQDDNIISVKFSGN